MGRCCEADLCSQGGLPGGGGARCKGTFSQQRAHATTPSSWARASEGPLPGAGTSADRARGSPARPRWATALTPAATSILQLAQPPAQGLV